MFALCDIKDRMVGGGKATGQRVGGGLWSNLVSVCIAIHREKNYGVQFFPENPPPPSAKRAEPPN